MTQAQVQALLVKPLEAASVFLTSGVRIFDVTEAGPVRMPRLVAMDAPNWHGENELNTEVNADFGEVTLLDGVKSLKSIRVLLTGLARSSVTILDSALQGNMTEVAAKLDAAKAGTIDVARKALGGAWSVGRATNRATDAPTSPSPGHSRFARR